MDAEQPFGVKSFPSDNSKLAEMEFYLVGDLECDLTVFHPYRTLTALCKKESASESMAEAGEVGVEVDDGPRYWGTGEGQLELSDDALQIAWSIINDTYRSDLFYPAFTNRLGYDEVQMCFYDLQKPDSNIY
ncbi:hypothetical protein EV363DRAFT_1455422 [Boletus edulis]|nr:hypothetical protein EV363DRAFT_1455422 [Boletus edulis]